MAIVAMLVLCKATLWHTFYASICEVKEGGKGLEVKVKIFTDDLARALSYELGEENFSEEETVEKYIELRLSIWVNGEKKTFKWQKMEQDSEVTWCYLEAEAPNAIKSLKVKNELLIRSISQQVNIVRVRVNGQKHFFNLDKQIRFEDIKY